MIWHMMIWHIFKKDWKLMWPCSAGFAALQFALMAARLEIGRFGSPPVGPGLGSAPLLTPDSPRLFYVLAGLPVLSYLASAFLITAIVQLDAIPGVRLDWLVRPIRRRDLFLAKLLGVIAMVMAPIFTADLAGGLLNGLPLGQSFGAAIERSLWLWFSLLIVVFALASLTRNLMEAIVAGMAVAAAYSLLPTLFVPWRGAGAFAVRGRVDWMDSIIHCVVILIGAAALLALQYALRRTSAARLVTVGFLVALLLIPPVPWRSAFALEERLSANPAAANDVRISFVPDRDAARDNPVGPLPYDRSDASVMLPIHVTGLREGAILYGESSRARIVAQDGRIWDGFHMGIPTWRNDGQRDKAFNYILGVPRPVYERIADQAVRVEIEYFLTLLKVADSQTLPATGGNGRTRDLGWCGTKLNEAGGEILVGCVSAKQPSNCESIVLEDPFNGARNPPVGYCVWPNYAPFRMSYGPDALNRFTERLPFGTAGGVDQYPVKNSMLPRSRVELKLYEPETHFERWLTIPQIRLRDWATAD
jgi:hypothetical protein